MSIFPSSPLPLTILCVDDEDVHRHILQRLVAQLADSVIVAADGEEGLAVFAEKRPDIVLTDLMMPRMNGLDMSRAIRNIDSHVPIILMTSSTSLTFLEEAIDVGISQFLPKPIVKEKLLKALQRCYCMIDMRRLLKREQERSLVLVNALEQSPAAVIILDLDGTIEFMNQVCASRYGWHGVDLCEKNILNLALSEELNRLVSASRAENRQAGDEIELPLHNGETSCAKATVSVFSSTGNSTKLLVTLDDITDKKAMEAHLLRTQKLEGLGVMAGGIAHNFNNILTAIVGNAELALMRMPAESPLCGSINNIKTSALRAAGLAQQMLAYSGRGLRTSGETDLNAMLEGMLGVFEVSVSRQVAVILEPAPVIPLVSADVSQLREVMMNLVINASEAIGEKSGLITISTGSMEFDRSELTKFWLGEHLQEGRYVCLQVADNGCGMDKPTASKLFDPFFSTKFTGRGLGMASVVGIIKNLGGGINVTTAPGQGSTFTILLPTRTDS